MEQTEALHEHHRAQTDKYREAVKTGVVPSGDFLHPHRLSPRGGLSAKDAKYLRLEHLGGYEDYMLPHHIWTPEECAAVTPTFRRKQGLVDWSAWLTVQVLRTGWDVVSGYTFGRKLGLMKFTERNWILRIVFLETVAGVPGMMFALVRHLRSLRGMQRDHGWIHTLLYEAENERMHLMTALKIYQPKPWFRGLVLLGQGILANFFFIAYFLSPRWCHRFVGFLEEQAVVTYTHLLKDIEDGKLPMFQEECEVIARGYWQLPEGATWEDVFRQIRCDEAKHRDTNHALAPLSIDRDAANPFRMELQDRAAAAAAREHAVRQETDPAPPSPPSPDAAGQDKPPA